MNGNFEIDKSRYPYGPVAVGDAWQVWHVPTQQEVAAGLSMPATLASRVALRLNTQYHASKAGGKAFDGGSLNVLRLVRESLAEEDVKLTIGGAAVSQITQRLEAVQG